MEENKKNKVPNVPNLRFKSFNKNWFKYKNSELFSYRSERKKNDCFPIASASQEKGMVIRSENGIDIKYEESSTSNYKIVRNGDYVIHLRSFQGGYAFSKIDCACSPAYIILKPNNLLYYSFLKEYFMSDKFINSLRDVTYGIRDGRTISHEEWMKKYSFVPCADEQKKIVDFLNAVNDRIETQNKIISNLESLIKQINDNVFCGSKNHSIKDCITELSMRNKLGDINNVLSVSNKLGFVKQSEQFEDKEVASEDKSNYKIIQRGTFAYNPARINVGSISLYDKEEAGIVSPMYICFRCKNGLEKVLEMFFKSQSFKKEMNKRLEGSVRMCLTIDAMKNIKFHMPDSQEQKMLVLIEKLIEKKTLENNLLNAYLRQKDYLLSNLFI